jgi:hypothetical protein
MSPSLSTMGRSSMSISGARGILIVRCISTPQKRYRMHHFVAGIPMRLTAYTDHALHVLIALAALRGEQRVTIEYLARRHRVSNNHLMKSSSASCNLAP